ncbi:MAG: GNAT family N-acetyltransferase [Steroidobacteraceae bacterium]|nr:GNAT family N-acetyltransferase [Steroidobacteraceae bacterium]
MHALLAAHLEEMHSLSPPGSVHTLPLDELRKPDVTFWTAWAGGALLGCGALKELSLQHGEVKSMRTAPEHRRRGVGRDMLLLIMGEARRRGYRRLSLETGSAPAFEPGRRLYGSLGFTCCPPFGNYVEDPHSVFMTLVL